MSEPPPSKKLVPVDGTSREGASERLALVAARRQAGDFHPMAEALHSALAAPAALLSRVGLVGGGLVALELSLRALGIYDYQAETYVTLAAFLGVIPAWGIVVMGGVRDRLDGRDESALATVRRWFPEMWKATPVQALYFGVIYGLLFTGPPLIEPGSLSPIELLAGFGFGTMCWGYFVAERVLHDQDPRDAALRGPIRALFALAAIPRDFLSWIRRPSWNRLSSGNLIQVPYFLSIWIAGGLFGYFTLSFFTAFWWDLFLSRCPAATGFFGVALAFELTVAACGYNELARASGDIPLEQIDATSEAQEDSLWLEEPVP